MNNQQAKYELLKEHGDFRNNYTSWFRLSILIFLCVASSVAVFATWSAIYRQSLNYPPQLTDIPYWWVSRAESYSNYFNSYNNDNNLRYSINSTSSSTTTQSSSPPSSPSLLDSNSFYNQNGTIVFKQIENERIYPSKLGNFIYKSDSDKFKLICYYSAPNSNKNQFNNLYLNKIDPNLCTHLNIGLIGIRNNQLYIDTYLNDLLHQTKELKIKNQSLKILLWVGGGGSDSNGFKEMIKNHANRKLFIQSLKFVLEKYHLDGIDLDWEFPSAYNKERQHFSQLLHEIRREYQREHRTYLLSVAVAAPEGIIYFAYDIREINNYADYVNIMTYDYHFYTKGTPFTGLNAPLYARRNEHSILGTLNINNTVNYWKNHGLDKNKIIVGLPTYGHSFRLVNPYNNGIGSPAQDIGRLGTQGFVSYSELCWFKQNNIYVNNVFDVDTCSPYLYSGLEWISYDDEKSLECKTNYVKSNEYGGVMIFSLNTDDHNLYCIPSRDQLNVNSIQSNSNDTFPLVRKIRSILFDKMKR